MRLGLILTVLLLLSISAEAQTPSDTPPPPPLWTGNFSAGLALTNGNTDTKNVNLGFALVRDPKKISIIRLSGLYLRGDKQSVLIVNQTQFSVRDELALSPKLYAFSQGTYLKDTFKGIQNVYSGTAGLGYKLINNDSMLFAADTGLGGVWEHDIGQPRIGSGGYNAGERFSWKASKTTTVNQSISSLWKTNNWGDALHNFSASVAVSVSRHGEIKIEVLDTMKNHPQPGFKKNDTSMITAFVWKL